MAMSKSQYFTQNLIHLKSFHILLGAHFGQIQFLKVHPPIAIRRNLSIYDISLFHEEKVFNLSLKCELFDKCYSYLFNMVL